MDADETKTLKGSEAFTLRLAREIQRRRPRGGILACIYSEQTGDLQRVVDEAGRTLWDDRHGWLA